MTSQQSPADVWPAQAAAEWECGGEVACRTTPATATRNSTESKPEPARATGHAHVACAVATAHSARAFNSKMQRALTRNFGQRDGPHLVSHGCRARVSALRCVRGGDFFFARKKKCATNATTTHTVTQSVTQTDCESQWHWQWRLRLTTVVEAEQLKRRQPDEQGGKRKDARSTQRPAGDARLPPSIKAFNKCHLRPSARDGAGKRRRRE